MIYLSWDNAVVASISPPLSLKCVWFWLFLKYWVQDLSFGTIRPWYQFHLESVTKTAQYTINNKAHVLIIAILWVSGYNIIYLWIILQNKLPALLKMIRSHIHLCWIKIAVFETTRYKPYSTQLGVYMHDSKISTLMVQTLFQHFLWMLLSIHSP